MEAEQFDAVVVGSGFGGSVVAYRLAEVGRSVCVLERGRSWPPGSFPRTPLELSRGFWDPSEGHYGMFDLWTFKGTEALVSSGLGGGSLIYANVLLRKDESWFVQDHPFKGGYEHWPVTYRDLEPHYEQVERMLGATPYPFDKSPYDETAKTIGFHEAAKGSGHDPFLPNLAVTFGNDPNDPVTGDCIHEPAPNLHGRVRYTCRLCGECDVGCNYGSKNTLDYTYLSRAKDAGAVIRDLCEVKSIQPDGKGGYLVGYLEHSLEREGSKTKTSELPLRTVACRRLILGAGAFGSTYLLLRNLEALPAISQQAVGTRFSGNGDLLGFVRRARRHGDGRGPRVLDPSGGPVITSALRVPDELDGDGGGRGFYIEDGGYPDFLSWMVEAANVRSMLGRVLSFVFYQARSKLSRSPKSSLGASMAALLGDARASSATLPFLGMGRDVPDGRMYLSEDGYLRNDWTMRTSRPYFRAVRREMKGLAKALDGGFRVNPIWYLRRVITVHPLGGCPMGRGEQEGVVDQFGEAFGHPGLYVVDGAAMPGPVGPNPSLTIAAFANRCADRMLEQTGDAP